MNSCVSIVYMRTGELFFSLLTDIPSKCYGIFYDSDVLIFKHRQIEFAFFLSY